MSRHVRTVALRMAIATMSVLASTSAMADTQETVQWWMALGGATVMLWVGLSLLIPPMGRLSARALRRLATVLDTRWSQDATGP